MVKRAVGIVAITALLVSAGMAGAALAQEEEATTQATQVAEDVGNTVCPVCNAMIDEDNKVAVEYNGKIYSVCSGDCKEMFLSDPETYSALADAEVAALAASEAADETALTEMEAEKTDTE